ncbi:sorbitol/mannitol transport system permease protein [Arthrobacter sp. ok909]|uniref:carbohydrate ABC transporter permease n=1 Tax=Arthrobacter sp. ok909 TaxID=1761746 RepID=UPI0008878EFE|nr:carbohydrate ABC transporter permease [Arthrobacter sp. ok909]SDP42966.1 sorbitol/mannitol transport system permease protein [Arthrobacter sp. ok909]
MTTTSSTSRGGTVARVIIGRTFLWTWLLVGLVPLLFMFITSIKPAGIANQIPPAWIFQPTLDNYVSVLSAGDGKSESFGQLLTNSAIVSLGATALAIVVGVPAAYALTMRDFRARKGLSSWILSTYMFPPIVAVIPVFVFAGKLGLMDTYPALIIPYAAFNLPIVVWILRSSILQLPYEIQEAAMVDGASTWEVLRRIIWPLLVPSVATAAVLTIVLSWNEFLFALSLTRSGAKTAPVGLQQFTGMYGTDWGSITAAATLIVAPILVLMVVLRRQMVAGLTFGAVK